MSNRSELTWEERARAAEKTVAVLQAKVVELYNGGQSVVARQLERARAREEENRKRRAVIAAKAGELKKYSRTLELEVEARTRDLKVILDNVTFGFLVVDRELQIQDGYTASCRELTGRDPLEGLHLLDALGVHDERDRDLFLLCADQVFEDLLAPALLVDQLPSRFEVGTRVLRVEARQIRDEDGRVAQLLMTMSDVSALEAAEHDNAVHQALLVILKERDAFKQFLADTRAHLLLARESITDAAYVRRVFHTIKGNAASYGLQSIVAVVHAIEDEVELGLEHIDATESAFREFLAQHEDVLEISYDAEDGDSELLQVSATRMAELREMIEHGPRDGELRRWTAEVYLKPARALLGPFPLFVSKLAERLEKSVEFEGHGLDIMVDAPTLQPIFQNLTHLVRNAVDHGIESADERGDKPEEGKVSLRLRDEATQWVFEMSDDGRGIDTEQLVRRSLEKGIVEASSVQAMSESERLELMFLDGVSTALETTELSGRGVGMSVVRTAVEGVGGTITPSSQPGQGTTFEIRVPKPEILRTRPHTDLEADAA